MALFKRFFRSNRSRNLELLARDLGLEFSRKDEFALVKKMGNFELFRKGGYRKITNLMAHDDGQLESSHAIFDYQYTVSTGNSSATFVQTVFFMDSKKLGLPPFILKPEHFFHRMGKFLNLVKDIEFEEHPEFSKKYLIQSDYPDMVKDLVSEDVIKFFTINQKWSLEGVNHYLILYRHGKTLKPETIKDFYKGGLELVSLLQTDSETEP